MGVSNIQTTLIETGRGQVRIHSDVDCSRLAHFTLAREFETDFLSRTIFTGKEILQRIVGNGGKVSCAVLDMKTIVGFATLAFPSPKSRWGRVGDGVVIELSSVAVIPEFRKYRIAGHLVDQLISGSRLEKKIVYLISYRWIWDLDQTNLTASAYRQLLVRLFSPFGFQESSTNDPNVSLAKENLFMVRMGKDVAPVFKERFKWARFGVLLE